MRLPLDSFKRLTKRSPALSPTKSPFQVDRSRQWDTILKKSPKLPKAMTSAPKSRESGGSFGFDGDIWARLVESMGGIILRTSQLDPDVLVSPHPAPDVLGLRLYSCVDNRGSFREPLRGY